MSSQPADEPVAELAEARRLAEQSAVEDEAAADAAAREAAETVTALREQLARAEQTARDHQEARAEAERVAIDLAEQLARRPVSPWTDLEADPEPEPAATSDREPEPSQPGKSIQPGTSTKPAASPIPTTPTGTSGTAGTSGTSGKVALPAAVAASAARGEKTRRPYVAVRRGSTGIVSAVLSLGCVAAVVVLAVQGRLADQTNLAVGLGVGAFLTALFAYRRIGSSIEVRLESDGTLKLSFGEAKHTFDLAPGGTEILMLESPGDRGWRIQLMRRGLPPLEIDAASVDPVLFTEALRQWRPNL